MVKIDYEPSDVLISLREPYNKKTIWIHPKPDNIEVKIFDNGWKLLSLTKDNGLSDKAKTLVKIICEEFLNFITEIVKKQFGKFSSNNNILFERLKALEERVKQLEDKIDKMNKKYSMIKNNG